MLTSSHGLMVGEKPFNTEHRLNEFKHIEPIKQKKRGLALERNEVIWATHQKVIDKVFNNQIRRNLEVHVDDMCSFGVEEGPFLGHLITQQRIKAKPLKVKGISDLKPPKTVKEIPSLNEKLAALSRFLSKGAYKALPILKILKNCTDKKIVHWTTYAEEAFQKMKEFIETLSTLTAPIKGETLVMYLAASVESISAVLSAERGKSQVLIYFINRTLLGAELDYPKPEKLILALVYIARRV
ncbi:reverse transcriptase domain-containing protein [Tanacetum coccineum]